MFFLLFLAVCGSKSSLHCTMLFTKEIDSPADLIPRTNISRQPARNQFHFIGGDMSPVLISVQNEKESIGRLVSANENGRSA